MADKKAAPKATIQIPSSLGSMPELMLGIFVRLAPKIIGIDIKKENLAASALLIPRLKPARMVIPERDVPGIKAKA